MVKFACCNLKRKKFSNIDSLSCVLKVVSEQSRLQILCILQNGEHCVCEILEHLGLSQSLVSHHLKDLKDFGIVKSAKKGLNVHYSLTARGAKLVDQIFEMEGVIK